MKSRCGIEIEFVTDGAPLVDIMNNLTENGIEVRQESYNHETRSWWKMTTDSSCGMELVSPILSEQTYRSTRAAMSSIVNGGGLVNRQCGFHVHIEPPVPTDFDEALAVVDLYNAVFDDILRPMLSASRLDNQYCRRWDSDDYHDDDEDSRYVAVNLTSLSRYGTIEFRQHQGTLNSTKALTWMQMMDTLTSVALGGGTKSHYVTALRACLPAHHYSYAVNRGVLL